jgi:hypothetical protein
MRIRSRKWQRKVTPFVAFAAALLAGIAPVAAQNQQYPEPDQQLQPLKNQFNADAGKVRLLLVLDPSCPPCRKGASIIRENVMDKISTDKLVAYVIWVPLLNLQDSATLQRHAHEYAKLLPGSARVTHYSDPQANTGKSYGPIIGVPYGAPAWDVYLAFAADAHWGDAPPTPSYWEHQLGGLPSSKFLDGPRFAEEVRKLLAKAGQ